MFRGKAEKKVLAAGYDPARLPPGPVPDREMAGAPRRLGRELPGRSRRLGLHASPARSTRPLTLTWEQLSELPRVEVTQDIHCVTRWSRFDASFEGIPWSALRELAGPRPTARFAIAHAEAGFTANVPIEFLEREGAMLATHADGEPLSRRSRLAAAPDRAREVLLEEREVAARDRAHGGRPSRLLGALRVPQRRRPVRGGALRASRPRAANPPNRGTGNRTDRPMMEVSHPPPDSPKRPFPRAVSCVARVRLDQLRMSWRPRPCRRRPRG